MKLHRASILAAVGVAAIAAVFLPRLRLDTGILAILPDLPAATDYREYVEAFGGLDDIYVAIEARAEDGLAEAGDVAHLLAERLAESAFVSAARCGLTAEDEAFWFESVLPRAILLRTRMGSPDLPNALERLEPDAIRARIAGMRARLAGPLGAFEGRVFAADPVGLASDLHPTFAASVTAEYDPGLDAFVSRSRDRVLVVVTPAFEELDAEAGKRLVATLEETFVSVRDALGADVAYQAIGGPIYAVHDASIIRADVIRTTVGSSVLVFLVLLAYFGGLRVPVALTLSLGAAVLWIAGGVAISRGYLSVFGISFGAILIGLGVDYGIHAASVFRDTLAAGSAAPPAMRHAIRATGPAILTSAVTTGAAFLVLASSPVSPVREMGWLIAAGIAAVLLASILLGAPLVVILFESFERGRDGTSFLRRRVGMSIDRIVDAACEHRGWVLLATAIVTAVALVGLGSIRFNADLRSLRPRGGDLEAVERMFVREFGLDLDTLQIVVSASDLGEALLRVDRLAEALTARLDAAVESAATFVPYGALAAERVASLTGRIDPAVPDVLRAELERSGFNVDAFRRPLEVLDAVAAGETPRDLPLAGWPDWIRRDVRVDAERASVALRLVPRERPAGEWPPDDWLVAIRQIAPDARVVSVPLLGRELRSAVGDEFRRLLAWSGAIVAFVVLLSFRGRPLPSLLALTPVAIGSVWLLGLCGWLGLPIEPFSVMVAPVLLGIGIDDGLHALHGMRQGGGLSGSVRRVGSAMTATTLTTAAGFGSLLLSRAPALQQAGFLVATGTLLCLVVSLTLLPALGEWVATAAARMPPADDLP